MGLFGMSMELRYFGRRRLRNVAMLLVALAMVAVWTSRKTAALESSAFFTGWLLLGSLFFLAAFQLRKRIPAPPLGPASAWLQLHIYVGLGAIAVFAMHVPWRWPNGPLETALYALFATTSACGLAGLALTRTAPRKLTSTGEEFTFEQIPMLRGQLRDQAQAVVLGAVRDSGEATIGEFYEQALADFFAFPRSWRYRLWPNNRERKVLLAELGEITRYLSDSERQIAEKLFALIRKRDDLDYHEALQWRLKAWLFVHIGLTYPLLIVAALHAWLAHLFTGSLP